MNLEMLHLLENRIYALYGRYHLCFYRGDMTNDELQTCFEEIDGIIAVINDFDRGAKQLIDLDPIDRTRMNKLLMIKYLLEKAKEARYFKDTLDGIEQASLVAREFSMEGLYEVSY